MRSKPRHLSPMHEHHRTTLLLILVVAATTTSSSLTGHEPSSQPQGRRHANNGTAAGTIGCLAHERDALLEFKRGITSDPYGFLASWQPGERQQDCCRGRGVRCSNRTGHVVGLRLRNLIADEAYNNEDLSTFDGALVGQISSSLLSLQHLEHLDLSLNELQGPTGRIPEFLGSLKNLRHLNLSSIPFNGRVPSQLGNLSKLHHLDLSKTIYPYNSQLHSADISWLARIPSLQYLSLSYINLTMVLDAWAHVVNMMPDLRVLDLSNCWLTSANQSLPHLNNLTKIERLDLSGNYFQHPVASCWFWNLTSHRYLGLGRTHLYGQFHHALGGMRALQVLDFSLSDGTNSPYITNVAPLDIMTADMRNLCNLEILILSSSYMDGNITKLFERLPKCSTKLKELHLDTNDFTGVIPNWIGRWASLLVLDLSNNRITGPLPSQIGMLNRLLTLDLSNNQMIGPLPSEISMLSNLSVLYLGGNNLTGVVTHESLAGLTSLIGIYLSSNSLKIAVRPDWLPPFSLQYAYFASCEMGPQFPTWLQSQVKIVELDISCAAIFDSLPDWFGTTFSNASIVNISHNGVSGTLPTSIESMTSLGKLYLNSNQLSGPLPRFPESLQTLDISRNYLSGPLPSDFGAPNIWDLRLYSNRITGHVPNIMCQMQFLNILDLSNNLLEGGLPECFQAENIFMLILSNNRFSGKFPPSLQRCTGLYILDLDSNKFNGELPMWIGNMVNLEIVRLGHNTFSGSIPATITNLTKLLQLDLAANNLSGVLPQNLSNLQGMTARGSPTTFGHYVPILNLSVSTKGDERYYEESQIFNMVVIDLSSNFLTGEIPEGITSLDRVVAVNFSRNRLSGKIPSKIGVMRALESLDLSENKLYGELPQSLSNLTYLSYLDLSYNNFTGRVPAGGQLDTLYWQHPFM
ncbi:hypothetical protein BS78_05G181200 [Paspalum vaginatum]|nr:hypothetical protein BS78_05G181200 [Paspalum vaginatum]